MATNLGLAGLCVPRQSCSEENLKWQVGGLRPVRTFPTLFCRAGGEQSGLSLATDGLAQVAAGRRGRCQGVTVPNQAVCSEALISPPLHGGPRNCRGKSVSQMKQH